MIFLLICIICKDFRKNYNRRRRVLSGEEDEVFVVGYTLRFFVKRNGGANPKVIYQKSAEASFLKGRIREKQRIK